MGANLLVDVQDDSGTATAPDELTVRTCLSAAIETVSSAQAPAYEIAVRFVDEHEGRALNRQFRHQDKPTNVLSFPAIPPAGLPATEHSPLGDIVICGPVIEHEAATQSKKAIDHWSHMLVHGALHLLGFDHQDDSAAKEMERLETEVLAACGIEDPYRE